jgi:hypothetical protein
VPWGFPDTFVTTPLAHQAWGKPVEKPTCANDEIKKKLFGVELAKGHQSPFAAAIIVFGRDTNTALWVANNWLADPTVLAARDLYLKTLAAEASLLDKDQLAARLLAAAEEKFPNGISAVDPKDKVAYYKLYAELRGFINNKIDINASTNNFTHNEMKITLVEPDQKPDNQIKTIEHHEPILDDDSNDLVEIKLVG